jgi:hypothetical protein
MRRIKIKRRSLLFILPSLLLLIVGGVFLRKAGPARPLTITEYYALQLRVLHDEVNELSSYLNERQNVSYPDINADITKYNALITKAQQPCKRLQIEYEDVKTSVTETALADAMSNTKSLCDDLSSVLIYAKDISHAISDYLLLSTTNWPAAGNGKLSEYADQIMVTVTRSKQALNDINSRGVDDPGRQELIAQLEQVENRLTKVKSLEQSGDTATADQQSAETKAAIIQDRQDFRHAQEYFWRNTVQMEALIGAVERLQGDFKPAK